MALTNIPGATIEEKAIQLVLLVDSDGTAQSISGGGGGGGGAMTVADGADVAEGARADAAWASGSGSVISLLKAIATKAIASIAMTTADGANVAQGAVADAAWTTGSGTTISLLKAIAAKIISSVAVTQADGSNVAQGAVADAAWASGNGTVVSLLKAIAAKAITSIAVTVASLPLPTGASTETTLSAASAKLPATLGQKAMSASMAIVVASDQSAVPVSAASLPLPSGASTEATLSAQSAKLPSALSTNGGLKVSNVDLIEGENQTAHRMMTLPKYTPTYIVTATTTTVLSGPGVLHSIAINKTVASATVTIYDNTAGSGTVLGVITQPAALVNSQICQMYDIAFATGLTIVTVGAQDITVSALAG